MAGLLALAAIIFWPVVPLFWIPIHCRTNFFRKLGLLSYILPLITWLPLACLIYSQRVFLLHDKLIFPAPLKFAGVFILLAGTALHVWTARLLGIGIIGVPEITNEVKATLMTRGPFGVVRHPTYLAHTLMFLGVFLISGVVTVGVVTAIDFVIINAFVIPLEERELVDRFGEEYRGYQKRVPRLFPHGPVVRRH